MQTPLFTLSHNQSWLRIPPINIHAGQIVMLHGDSGSGKSRLLRAITDLDPNDLQLTLQQQTREQYSPASWRQQVQYLPAEPVWWSEYAAEMISDEVAPLAEIIGLNLSLLDQPIGQLSTGERQRCALLRSLSVQPRVLLLDEPTAALDPSSVALVEQLLQQWVQEPERAIIWVSHNPAQRQRLGQQHWHINQGALQCQ